MANQPDQQHFCTSFDPRQSIRPLRLIKGGKSDQPTGATFSYLVMIESAGDSEPGGDEVAAVCPGAGIAQPRDIRNLLQDLR